MNLAKSRRMSSSDFLHLLCHSRLDSKLHFQGRRERQQKTRRRRRFDKFAHALHPPSATLKNINASMPYRGGGLISGRSARSSSSTSRAQADRSDRPPTSLLHGSGDLAIASPDRLRLTHLQRQYPTSRLYGRRLVIADTGTRWSLYARLPVIQTSGTPPRHAHPCTGARVAASVIARDALIRIGIEIGHRIRHTRQAASRPCSVLSRLECISWPIHHAEYAQDRPFSRRDRIVLRLT